MGKGCGQGQHTVPLPEAAVASPRICTALPDAAVASPRICTAWRQGGSHGLFQSELLWVSPSALGRTVQFRQHRPVTALAKVPGDTAESPVQGPGFSKPNGMKRSQKEFLSRKTPLELIKRPGLSSSRLCPPQKPLFSLPVPTAPRCCSRRSHHVH